MTHNEETPQNPDKPDPPSTSVEPELPFDPTGWTKLRCRPAEFARMVGVSKQAVSVWIKKGIVTLGADGMLDPNAASRRVLAQVSPGRLRARLFRDLATPAHELAAKIRKLEADLEAERDRHAAVVANYQKLTVHRDDLARQTYTLEKNLVARFDELVQAQTEGMLQEYVAVLIADAFGHTLDIEADE